MLACAMSLQFPLYNIEMEIGSASPGDYASSFCQEGEWFMDTASYVKNILK